MLFGQTSIILSANSVLFLRKKSTLAKDIQPNTKKNYPENINTKPLQALYDNLGEDEELSIAMDSQIRYTKDDDWRSSHIKRRKVEIAIKQVFKEYGIEDENEVKRIFELISNQKEY